VPLDSAVGLQAEPFTDCIPLYEGVLVKGHFEGNRVPIYALLILGTNGPVISIRRCPKVSYFARNKDNILLLFTHSVSILGQPFGRHALRKILNLLSFVCILCGGLGSGLSGRAPFLIYVVWLLWSELWRYT